MADLMSMQCLSRKEVVCSCTVTSCPRHGLCCQCVAYHRKSAQLPGCFFSPAAEAARDRSYANFCKPDNQFK